jgi:tRNA(Arg) A34 adenosine deaminase TadA
VTAKRPRLVIELLSWVGETALPGRAVRDDQDAMALAIRLAEENVARGDGGPFGAAVFEIGSGMLVAAGVNLVIAGSSSVLHAEMVALMFAQQRVGSFSLRSPGGPAHQLVTSCEPCAMCQGATLWSGVTRLFMGAAREDAMAVGFEEGPVFPESYAYIAARGVQTVRGLRRVEAAALLRAYHDNGRPHLQLRHPAPDHKALSYAQMAAVLSGG